MKKNVMMRVAAFLLVCVLATTCGISGTFAKYASDATGSAVATVAKWDIKLNDSAMGDYNFNLFDTVLDTLDDAAEGDVASGKIAPGTKGSFKIVLENDSEVNATYIIKLTCSNNTIPFTFTVGGNSYTYDQISTTGISGELAMNAAASTITVNWEWPFEGDEVIDMALAGTSLNFTASIEVTQKN